MKRMRRLGTYLLLLAPSVVLAQGKISTLWDVPAVLSNLLKAVYGILVAIGVFMVAFGVFKFIVHSDDEKAREAGRQNILWGIVGIFIMMSIWGLVNLLSTTIQLDKTTAPPIPQIPAS